MENTNEYLTPKEACELLGVTRKTLERYVERKLIAKYRQGLRNVLFKRSELEAFLQVHLDTKNESSERE